MDTDNDGATVTPFEFDGQGFVCWFLQDVCLWGINESRVVQASYGWPPSCRRRPGTK